VATGTQRYGFWGSKRFFGCRTSIATNPSATNIIILLLTWLRMVKIYLPVFHCSSVYVNIEQTRRCPMDCLTTQPLLDAYADGQVSARTALEISRHIESCAQCRTRLDRLGELTTALAVLPVPEPPSELARITLQAYRTRIRKSSFRQWWAMLGPGLRAAACGATAFGFVLGIFLALAVQDVRSAESSAE
jgi:hypothetical protein